MKYFRRVLQYVIPQYKSVIVSVLCALMVAVLFSLSIVAMLPLMKVMIGEEGLQGWIYRSVIKQRSGITFAAEPVREFLGERPSKKGGDKAKDDSAKKKLLASPIPLRIKQIEKNTPAAGTNLAVEDIVVLLRNGSINFDAQRDRMELMRNLAQAATDKAVTIRVKHIDGTIENISIKLARAPFYANTAYWLLSFIPQSNSVKFKRDSIILVIVLILITTILRCILRFAQEYIIRKISYRSIMMLRKEAYSRALRLPLIYFKQEGITDTMSRFVQDSNRVQRGITTVFGKVIREPFKVIAMAIWAFEINGGMTLIVIMGAPVAALILGKLGRKMKRATKRTLENWSRMLGHLQETLSGIQVVKAYHNEKYEEEKFFNINKKLLKQQARVAKINAASGPMLESLGITAACAGMIFAAYWMSEGHMKTSDFFTLVLLLGTMTESGRKLGNVIPRLQVANASAQRVYKLIDAPIEKEVPEAAAIEPLQKTIEMRNVGFTYPGNQIKTLKNISFKVKAGQSVAIVGPNGSGKTTLLSMIPRFYDPDEGAIYIDGHNIREVSLQSLRSQIGIVTQQTLVFNDTIAANIAYGKLDATQEEIVRAAKQAYADEFIMQSPEGYNTIIGEQGTSLSGGQLQRLAIARAILRDPAILLFDEATSQIDSDSEAKIQKALDTFSHGRTCFVIAHRLSTIINADVIVVLHQGEIVGLGQHAELIDSCKMYRQLYELQYMSNDK